MIYIVSGWIRHGTSMMMACLEAGGMEIVWSEEREREAQRRFGDDLYRGNDRYLELTVQDFLAPGFPLSYEGRVVKCLRQALLQIPAGGYRIVYMRRDGEETRQSAQALFNKALPAEWAQTVERETARVVGIMGQRRDVSLIEIPYRAVLADPLPWFERLREAGWPIDAEKSAAIVDPSKCRYRTESLQRGA